MVINWVGVVSGQLLLLLPVAIRLVCKSCEYLTRSDIVTEENKIVLFYDRSSSLIPDHQLSRLLLGSVFNPDYKPWLILAHQKRAKQISSF